MQTNIINNIKINLGLGLNEKYKEKISTNNGINFSPVGKCELLIKENNSNFNKLIKRNYSTPIIKRDRFINNTYSNIGMLENVRN